MADDGMLLNFDVADAPAVAKATFKGGRWKDRLTAKKSAQHNRRPRGSQRGANAEPLGQRTTAVDEDASRAIKRQKTSGITQTSSGANARGGKEVVSSLFTFNPKASTVASASEVHVPNAAPTNAPLPEGAANFTALGLGPLVASYLAKKLELKTPTAIQESTISQLLKEDSDAFIQAETGSGKTLAYLLPIVQRLVSWSQSGQQFHRGSGLFAIILAPTRELCRQIQSVLDSLLGCAHWIVAGSVTGGERKKAEKARLRKGINILVATPGRLADHLTNTSALDVSNVRWLILDEGDRLMELGFEQEIKGIVEALQTKQSTSSFTSGQSSNGFLTTLPSRRVTVLCSATMKTNVQKLGEVSLKDAVHLQASDSDPSTAKADGKFSAPAQMKQSYIIVPPKQRLVTLTALLKKTFARRGSVMKAIVFLSCADSVDFHFEILRRSISEDLDETQKEKKSEPQQTASPPPSSPEPARKSKPAGKAANADPTQSGPITYSQTSQLASRTNPTVGIFRLHGSLAQPVRTSTLKAFSTTADPAILFCTDVASRGLDLPSIDLVIEYDPAFSAEDHLHRIGRTARAGREGRAILFLMPGPEEGYIELLEGEGTSEGGKRNIGHMAANEVLKRGFSEDEAGARAKADAKVAKGKFLPVSGNKQWEEAATDWQLEVERLALEDRKMLEMARKAYISHVRAYATHVVPERHMFDVKGLHLGHLAKAFGLRDRPGNMGRGAVASSKRSHSQATVHSKSGGNDRSKGTSDNVTDAGQPDGDIMAKMRKLARARERDQAGEFNFG